MDRLTWGGSVCLEWAAIDHTEKPGKVSPVLRKKIRAPQLIHGETPSFSLFKLADLGVVHDFQAGKLALLGVEKWCI